MSLSVSLAVHTIIPHECVNETRQQACIKVQKVQHSQDFFFLLAGLMKPNNPVWDKRYDGGGY